MCFVTGNNNIVNPGEFLEFDVKYTSCPSPDSSYSSTIYISIINENIESFANITTEFTIIEDLPKECEPYLMSYVQRRILNKISSQQVANENMFTMQERMDIED